MNSNEETLPTISPTTNDSKNSSPEANSDSPANLLASQSDFLEEPLLSRVKRMSEEELRLWITKLHARRLTTATLKAELKAEAEAEVDEVRVAKKRKADQALDNLLEEL